MERGYFQSLKAHRFASPAKASPILRLAIGTQRDHFGKAHMHVD
jgi:hypothetical protein